VDIPVVTVSIEIPSRTLVVHVPGVPVYVVVTRVAFEFSVFVVRCPLSLVFVTTERLGSLGIVMTAEILSSVAASTVPEEIRDGHALSIVAAPSVALLHGSVTLVPVTVVLVVHAAERLGTADALLGGLAGRLWPGRLALGGLRLLGHRSAGGSLSYRAAAAAIIAE